MDGALIDAYRIEQQNHGAIGSTLRHTNGRDGNARGLGR